MNSAPTVDDQSTLPISSSIPPTIKANSPPVVPIGTLNNATPVVVQNACPPALPQSTLPNYEALLEERQSVEPIEEIHLGNNVTFTVPAVPTDEYIRTRRETITRLRQYDHFFKHKLVGFDFTNLETLSLQQLAVLEKDVKFSISMTNGASTLRTMSKNAFNLMGQFVDAPGLGTALDMNQEYVDSIHEAGIEYSKALCTDPLVRISYVAVATAIELRTQKRKVSEICNPFLASTVEPEMKRKYTDL